MKVPEPRKLKSGTYFIQLRLSGVSVSVSAPTATECKHKAELIKAQHRAGKRVIRAEEKTVTMGKLLDRYVSKYESVLSPATIRGYNSIRKNRFPDYMDVPISSIKKWQDVINKELETKSEHTVRNGWGAVTAAMGDAGLAIPKVKLAKVEPVHDTDFLEPEEIKKFLKAAEGDKAEIEMLLELHGLRESECMYVVRNNQIDIAKGIINVSGAIVPDKNHKFVEKQTNKNQTSTRKVPIMIPRLATLVQYHKDNNLPIKTHSASALLNHVHKTCERAGITIVGNHGLRKSFASLCFSLKTITDKQIQEWGGWSDSQTMKKIYIRLASKDKEDNKKAVTDFFSGTANS